MNQPKLYNFMKGFNVCIVIIEKVVINGGSTGIRKNLNKVREFIWRL